MNRRFVLELVLVFIIGVVVVLLMPNNDKEHPSTASPAVPSTASPPPTPIVTNPLQPPLDVQSVHTTVAAVQAEAIHQMRPNIAKPGSCQKDSTFCQLEQRMVYCEDGRAYSLGDKDKLIRGEITGCHGYCNSPCKAAPESFWDSFDD